MRALVEARGLLTDSGRSMVIKVVKGKEHTKKKTRL